MEKWPRMKYDKGAAKHKGGNYETNVADPGITGFRRFNTRGF
jgi:hypothetical protein